MDPFDTFFSKEEKILRAFGGKIVFRNGNELVMTVLVTLLCTATENLKYFLMSNVQRDIDWKRVEKMSSMQLEEYKRSGRFGIASTIITIGQCDLLVDPKSNPLGIKFIDGQHRRATWADIIQQAPEMCICQDILVKINKYKTVDAMEEDFRIINDNFVPVNRYFLNATIKDVADQVVNWLRETYPKTIFKMSDRPQVPFINLDIVRHHLGQCAQISAMIEKKRGDSQLVAKWVIKRLRSLNNTLVQKSDDCVYFKKLMRITLPKVQEKLDKCNRGDNPCFLGVYGDCEWIEKALLADGELVDDEDDVEDEDEDEDVDEDEEEDEIRPRKIRIRTFN